MFDARGFCRFLHLWLFRTPWTPRRALVTVALLAVLPPWQLLVWLTLLLDELLYPAYRRRPVSAPVFITGHFRSGTTHLHRLMAQDTRFSTAKMWEILFAPSILLRRIAAALGALDRLTGGRLTRLWRRRVEAGWQAANPMHEVSLFAPEEDEYLLLHRWSALTIGLSAGQLDAARPYAWFDHALPRRARARIMQFYQRCIQRHLHAHARRRGATPCYLAKNPALCPKLDSLLTQFPDARVIYLLRNPVESVPSFLHMMRFSWQAVGLPWRHEQRLETFLIEMAAHWYRYPLRRLAELPPERYLVVDYDELVRAPRATLDRIYRHFGLDMPAQLRRRLQALEQGPARSHSAPGARAEELERFRLRVAAELDDVIRRVRPDPGG